jgi:hypothetical protein
MRQLFAILAVIVLAVPAAFASQPGRMEVDRTGNDDWGSMLGVGPIEAPNAAETSGGFGTQDGAEPGYAMPINDPISSSHFTGAYGWTTSATNYDFSWVDLGIGKQAYKEVSLMFAQSGATAGATIYVWGWTGSTPLTDSTDGVQIGSTVHTSGFFEVTNAPRWIRIEVADQDGYLQVGLMGRK